MELWGKFGMGSISCHESVWLSPTSKLTILPKALGRLSHCKNKDSISDLILRWEMKPLQGTSQWPRLMRRSCLHPSPFPPGVADRTFLWFGLGMLHVPGRGPSSALPSDPNPSLADPNPRDPSAGMHFRTLHQFPRGRKSLSPFTASVQSSLLVLAAVGRSSMRKLHITFLLNTFLPAQAQQQSCP